MVEGNRSDRFDALIACALACTLAAIWSSRDWTDLSALRLPDADDMMRLQQIRDWLGGQSFADLTQYRLGQNGVAMHWSRLADLVPAALIGVLQGILGRHQAELFAVIVWPALLLVGAIYLTGRIGQLVGGPDVARPTMVVAAIAYPASTLFVPGRIDHHGLQLVLLLITVLALLWPGSLKRGMIMGAAITLSLVVGMEMAPVLAAVAAIAITEGAIGERQERKRVFGLGIALAATTLSASFVFRTLAWDFPACDGFTAVTAKAMLICALLPIGLAIFGSGLNRRRAVLLLFLGTIVLLAALWRATPQCLSPYGGVDLSLRRLWLSRVAEAQPLFEASPAVALGYGGLLAAGLCANAWLVWTARARSWIILLVLQLVAAAVTVTQLRGAYAGALLVAPALGAMIVAGRRSGTLPLVGAWLVSAGIFYPMAAEAMSRPSSARGNASFSCTAPDLIAALGHLPTGLVMAPIDTGAPAIASTNQRLLAGAYHRNGAGNLAMYAFYRGSSEMAHRIAVERKVSWVVACDGFGDVSAPFSGQLEQGMHPSWLTEVAHVPSGGRIFATGERPGSARSPGGM